MRYSFLSPLFVLIAALVGCKGPDATCDNETISFKRLQYSATYKLVNSADDYETESDLSFNCAADMIMPVSLFGHDVSSLRDSILKIAFDTVGVDSHAVVEEYFQRCASEVGYQIADTTVADSSYDGLATVDGVVESLSPTILSYSITNSDYMPRAAHGIYGNWFVNYDIVNGKVFALSDIFTPEGLEQLPAILRRTALSMYNYIGRTDLEALPSGNNFCISADGEIVFVYQPYEIASFAQGEIRIPIAFYILSDLFTPYGNKLLMDAD